MRDERESRRQLRRPYCDGLSPILWLYIRRLRTWVRPRARFINLGEKIGGFLDQGRRKPRVACGSRELKKRRGLTHEILPANHDTTTEDLRPTPAD